MIIPNVSKNRIIKPMSSRSSLASSHTRTLMAHSNNWPHHTTAMHTIRKRCNRSPRCLSHKNGTISPSSNFYHRYKTCTNVSRRSSSVAWHSTSFCIWQRSQIHWSFLAYIIALLWCGALFLNGIPPTNGWDDWTHKSYFGTNVESIYSSII